MYLFTDKEIVVISYNNIKNVFFAWNAHIHNHIHSTANTIVLTLVYPRVGVQNNEVKCVYTYRNTHGYEKVVFIGMDALYEFCMNFDYYLTPNTSDPEFKAPALYISNDDTMEKLEADDVVATSFT